MTTDEAAEVLGLSKSGVQALANRHKLGKLRIGKDGRVYRHFSGGDVEFMRSRRGLRGRPQKASPPPENAVPYEPRTSLGNESVAEPGTSLGATKVERDTYSELRDGILEYVIGECPSCKTEADFVRFKDGRFFCEYCEKG